ncbi:hypothetical protein ACQ4M4_21460 [Leptolyngbya sp. AN02str]|uniref:hypothetical protein n=1 Tax=Leptolyngbya sp. AN02str TaxID=3423363 RepID=UPI003D31BC5B
MTNSQSVFPTKKPQIHLIWQVNPETTLESDWLYSLFPNFDVQSIEDSQHSAVMDNAIVVTSGNDINGISVKQYLTRFKAAGYRVGVIHLSDEWFTYPIDFYPDAAFVLRNFYRDDAFRHPHVYFIPLGYKRGLHQHITPDRPMRDRQHSWSFAGSIAGKISRRHMMASANRLPGGIAYISGNAFNDSSNLSFEGYAKLMSNTVFALSPGGNRCVETLRVYEAMEAGAIPVVEDASRFNILKGILKEIIKPKEFLRYKVWTWGYWRSNFARLVAPSYWLQVYGANFPCPRCSDWTQLDQLLATIDPDTKAQEVQAFWQGYKEFLRKQISAIVTRSFFTSMDTQALSQASPPSAPAATPVAVGES